MSIELTGTVIQKDISRIGEALTEGLSRLKYGSYSDRTPHLGKMRRCPYCGKRRREFSIATDPCCNPAHTETVRDRKGENRLALIKCEPRVTDISTKTLVKKFKNRMRPGYGARYGKEKYDANIGFQEETSREHANLLLNGLVGFHTPTRPVEVAAVPAFSEKWVEARHKGQARRKRKQQQLARRINFGLKAGRNG